MFKTLLRDIIFAGLVDEGSADVRKQILISSILSLAAFSLLILYGLDSCIKSEFVLAGVVLLTAVISGLNYLYLRRTGNYRVSSMVIVIFMSVLCLYLLCTGGSGNTGPLWFFVMPSLIFYVLGLKRGIIYLGTVLGVIFYILFIPNNLLLQTEYSLQFMQRFYGAMFSVSLISWIYEYTREDGRRELINLSRRLDQLSRMDELTGLSNRRDMFERLRNELSRFERTGRKFSVLLIDIDHFKSINDSHGHECGDDFLVGVAGVLAKNTQKRDGVARWGGEEFLTFLPETDGAQAIKTAERLRIALERYTLQYNGTQISTTVSIGIAEYEDGKTLNQLINRADKHLYLAKRGGRNRVFPVSGQMEMGRYSKSKKIMNFPRKSRSEKENG